jgi:hypothetical protein
MLPKFFRKFVSLLGFSVMALAFNSPLMDFYGIKNIISQSTGVNSKHIVKVSQYGVSLEVAKVDKLKLVYEGGSINLPSRWFPAVFVPAHMRQYGLKMARNGHIWPI